MCQLFVACLMTHVVQAATSGTRADCRQYLTSLCELERRGVRRPLKQMGSMVWFAAPLLACFVQQIGLDKLARQCSPNAPSPKPLRTHCGRPDCGFRSAGFDTFVSHSQIMWVCGHLNGCMICGWLVFQISNHGCDILDWFFKCDGK